MFSNRIFVTHIFNLFYADRIVLHDSAHTIKVISSTFKFYMHRKRKRNVRRLGHHFAIEFPANFEISKPTSLMHIKEVTCTGTCVSSRRQSSAQTFNRVRSSNGCSLCKLAISAFAKFEAVLFFWSDNKLSLKFPTTASSVGRSRGCPFSTYTQLLYAKAFGNFLRQRKVQFGLINRRVRVRSSYKLAARYTIMIVIV